MILWIDGDKAKIDIPWTNRGKTGHSRFFVNLDKLWIVRQTDDEIQALGTGTD